MAHQWQCDRQVSNQSLFFLMPWYTATGPRPSKAVVSSDYPSTNLEWGVPGKDIPLSRLLLSVYTMANLHPRSKVRMVLKSEFFFWISEHVKHFNPVCMCLGFIWMSLWSLKCLILKEQNFKIGWFSTSGSKICFGSRTKSVRNCYSEPLQKQRLKETDSLIPGVAKILSNVFRFKVLKSFTWKTI